MSANTSFPELSGSPSCGPAARRLAAAFGQVDRLSKRVRGHWSRGSKTCAEDYRSILSGPIAPIDRPARQEGCFPALLSAFRSLPPAHRAALALVAIEGLTPADAGSVLGQDQEAVRLLAEAGRDAVLAATAGQGARILIAEDERIAAFELREVLRRLGHTVVGIAATAEDALARAARDVPDLALVDVRLKGGGDGIGALRDMRTSAGVPGIVITAFGDQWDRAEGAEAGARGEQAYGFLVKPWGEQELRRAVSDALLRIAAERAALSDDTDTDATATEV